MKGRMLLGEGRTGLLVRGNLREDRYKVSGGQGSGAAGCNWTGLLIWCLAGARRGFGNVPGLLVGAAIVGARCGVVWKTVRGAEVPVSAQPACQLPVEHRTTNSGLHTHSIHC